MIAQSVRPLPRRIERWQIARVAHYSALTATVLAGAWLRVTALRRQSLWFDEIDVVVRAQQPLTDVVRTFARSGENGPLYNLLLAIWIRIAGISELAVRFPSAVAGALTIPLLYLLVRRIAGSTTGLLSAGLLAFSPYHIWYSQEAKMYAMLVLLVVASTLCYVEALSRKRARWWIAWVIVTSLMFYTHVASVLAFVAQVAYGLVAARRGRRWERAWLLAVGALTLPYLPIAVWALRVVGGGVATWQPDVSLWDAVHIIGIKFAVNRYDPSIEVRAALLYTALAAYGLLRLQRTARRACWLLLLCLAIVPVVGLWAVSLRQSVFSDRYAIVALPAWLTLVGAGLTTLIAGRRSWPLGALAAFALVVFAWGPIRDVNRTWSAEKEDWRSAWAELNRRAIPGDAIIVHPGYLITTHDYFAQREPGLRRFPVATIPSFRVGWFTHDMMVRAVARQIGDASRIWLVQSPDRVPDDDPDGRLEAWLRSSGPPLFDYSVTGVRVTLYNAPPHAP